MEHVVEDEEFVANATGVPQETVTPVGALTETRMFPLKSFRLWKGRGISLLVPELMAVFPGEAMAKSPTWTTEVPVWDAVP